MCPKCGTGLIITEGGKQCDLDGYTPFSADPYYIKTVQHLDKEESSKDKKD